MVDILLPDPDPEPVPEQPQSHLFMDLMLILFCFSLVIVGIYYATQNAYLVMFVSLFGCILFFMVFLVIKGVLRPR